MRAALNTLLVLIAALVLVLLFGFATKNTQAQLHHQTCSPGIDGVYAVQSDIHSPELLAQAHWQRVTLPDNWTTRWPNYTGVVWYRIDWQANCPADHQEAPLALLVNSMKMAGKVWLNNQLLWSDANLTEPLSRSWNSPRFLTLPGQSINETTPNKLYFRITGDVLSSPGLGSISIGKTQYIVGQFQKATWHQRTIFYLNIILSLTLGMVCSCIWLFRRQEVAYGWYALASVFWVGFIANTLVTETAPFRDTASFTQFNIAFFTIYILCFCIFSWRFLNKKFPRIEKTCFALTVILIASIWLVPATYLQLALLGIFVISILLFNLNSLFVSFLCFRTKQLELWLLGITLITCLALSAISLLSFYQLLNNITIVLPYTSLLFAIFLSITLALHLSKSLRRIERFNEELNQKIIEAEQKLALTLNYRHQLTIKNHQLKERLNLAHELHDGLGSALVRAMIEVGHAKETLSNKHTLSILSLLRNDLRQIIDNFSESQTKLPDNPIYWLAPLRNRFVQIFDDLDIELQWEVDPVWVKPPSSLQCLTLYRVAEEALTNVIKHSHARKVSFRCMVGQDYLELQIIDNGIGCNTVDIDRSGISVGMRSMRARIERLAGVLEIQSRPGETMITARAPYKLKKEKP